MIRNYRLAAALAFLILCSAGCVLTGGSSAPREPKGPFVENPATTYSGLSADQVRKAVVQSLTRRGWRVTGDHNQIISAALLVRSHTAEVTIPYAEGMIQINYVSSVNLKYNPETNEIHPTYNKWVNLLLNDINIALSQVKFGS